MNTITTQRAFNERAKKSQVSASWPHDQSHYRFLREHKSRAPFAEPGSANRAAEAVIGVLALAMIIGLLLFAGGAF